MASATTTGKEEKEEEELLLLLPVVHQLHPTHRHPLQLLDTTNHSSVSPSCLLCLRKISPTAEAYTCKERCKDYIYYHRLCVEAPPQIDLHPLHPEHPLSLHDDRKHFRCDFCDQSFYRRYCLFRCHKCDFQLDIACALSTLSDQGRYQFGKTSEQITLPLHPHPLTSFNKRHDFVENSDCYICKGSVEEDGYMCLRHPCEFVIHKECIQDLYYADGTKAPRVYHGHPMKTFIEEDTGSSRRCASCGSDKSGEFIGCETCRVFYHRTCFQVPEILQYPTHPPDHTLVLFTDTNTQQQCQSSSISLKDEIYYRCSMCEFFLHMGCASEVLAYYEEGMRGKIELPWHEHPLLLCHQTKHSTEYCSYCRDKIIGPTYVCEEKKCEEKDYKFILHKQCTEIEWTITHPHHPNHPLTLCDKEEDNFQKCIACGQSYWGLRFTCHLCLVYLHIECVGSFPTYKNYLHEHELVYLEYLFIECNRCNTTNGSPIFRCVPCNFNLHAECLKLPMVIKNDKIHWHSLTLHETFLEDDSGEYYCEHCEKMRDPRLGVYVCEQCKISMPRIYHIHYVLPELGQLYEKERLSYGFQKLKERISTKEEKVRAIEKKLKEETQKLTKELDEARQELDELMKEHNKILEDNQ